MFESSKDRTGLFDGKEAVFTEAHGKMLIDWLNEGDDPLADSVQAIKDCISLDELKNVWLSFPKHIQARVLSEKNNRKSEIEALEKQEAA